jgi:hypothetical protein
MKNILKADIRPSTAIELSVLKERVSGGNEPLSGKIITADWDRMIQAARPSPKPTSKSGKRLRSLVAHPARLLRFLGPGLVTGTADDDPSGIATYSQIGAQFGFAMLWTLVLSYPLMAAIQ